MVSSVIQGTADVGGKLSQNELSDTVDFCLNAFEQHDAEKHEAVLKKLEASQLQNGVSDANIANEARIEKKADVDPEGLSPDELSILKTIRARQMLRNEDGMNIDNFASDAIDGYASVVKRRALTLVKVGARAAPKLGNKLGIESNMEFEKKSMPITAHE